MLNPYQTSVASGTRQPVRRPWWPYLIVSVLLLIVGLLVAVPGLLLLNQEWQWVPVQSATYDIQINDRPISNAAVIRYSIGAAATLWCLAFASLAKLGFNAVDSSRSA